MRLGRVVAVCPDFSAPSGGVRKIYLHVDILNRGGIEAVVLHQAPGFRCKWFDNQTRVIDIVSYRPEKGDVFLIPEVLAASISKFYPGIPKVVFNQNCYLTFAGREPGAALPPYSHPDVVAVLTVSDDCRMYLQYAFPNVRLFRLRYGVDPTLYFPAPVKNLHVAYMPRKNAADVAQVVALLKCRHTLTRMSLLPIDGFTEVDAADALRRSAIFLSFGHPEGFGLPAAEAMACGCLVVGYHGYGGKEFFRPEHSWPIAAGDIVTFAKTVEETVGRLMQSPEWAAGVGARAAAFIRANYSLEAETEDILQFWRTIG